MSTFHIEGYQYSAQAISKVRQGHPLDLEVLDYQPLTLRQYITMRKSLALYAQYLEKSAPASISPSAKAKSAKKLGAGQRWITVHPNGRDDRGVPVLIQDHGDGTAHVVGGAAGRLNMLKLNNIKSKDEYRDIAKKKLEEARTKREAEKKALAIERAGMTDAQKKELREQEKAAKEMQDAREKEKQEKIKTAKNAFLQTAASILGWEDRSTEMYENYQAQREGAVEYLKQALDSEDEAQIKAAKKNLSVVEKGYNQAVKSYESNMMQAAKAAIRDIQKEAIADETIKAALEERIEGKTEAEEAIQTEKKGKSKGFMTEYAETAEKQGLSEEQLQKEKDEIFQESLDRIARDVDPRLAMMIEAGVATKRAISEVKRDIYQKEDIESRVKDLDEKAEMIKKYLEMKKVLKEEEAGKDVKEVQVTLEGEAVDEKEQEMVYGDGATITVSAADFLKDLANEERRIEGERQGEINRSLLDKIAENPNDPAKWLANGRFDGFNKVALTLMKTDAISRDVSDVLGLRTTAQVLARAMRLSMSKEDFADAAEAVQRMHADSEEALAQNALDSANGIFEKVQEIEGDIESLKAQNPDDLAQLQRLNATRLEYLDQANQVLAQTLGSLEATAMIGAEMKRGGAKGDVETNLGKISSEDAIYRLRALGLTDDEYHIETVSGNKVATITEAGLDKLAKTVDPADLALEREIEDIKRGVYDEEGWMPAGLVARPLDSYQDPGIDPEIPEGGLDNQSIADDANGMKAAQEAAHRALGEIPEGGFAFKNVDDLDLSEQSDIRRYWENHIYKGSMAEKYSVRQYQGEKGVTKAGAWQSFVSANGGMDDAAYEAILKDVIDNHSSEDMFGNPELPAVAQVIPGNTDSYRNRVDGANDLFDDIDTLRASIEQNLLTVPKATAEAELARKEAELPNRLEDLRKAQLRDHYHRWMSGYSEDQYAAGETGERYEGSAWAEYVRMHGDTKRAQQAVLDTIKGRFVDKFSTHYGRVTKKPLATERRSIAESKGHLLGMLGKEERDSVINKVQAELASAGATVANRAGGKFATGSWRDRALELIQQRRSDEAKQGSFFGEEELKQEDGTERMSIGKRAEEQLASMLPELSRNQLRGQKYAVSSMTTKGERQRAIKMFEKTKRMNLSFGTGKGKTILSIGSFTDLHSKGLAKRAIFAVPSVVQSQFGNEVNVFCEPGKYTVKSDPSMNREQRIEALKDGGNHMVVMTHQSIRDDLVYLMSTRMGKNEDETKKAFNAMSEKERADYLGATLKDNGISFDMLTIDEAHYTTNRKGKEDSTLANVLDALNKHTPYYMNQTATPVKNDPSEAFDILHKVAPDKFNNRNDFLKKYGVDSPFARESLQRLINRYNYASRTVTGVKSNRRKEAIPLSDAQQTAYDEVNSAFQRASRAKKAGSVDVEAVKLLSPNSFKGKPDSEHQAIAEKIQAGLGTMKEEALNRVVNQFDPDSNAKVSKLMEIIESKRYDEDMPKSGAKKGDRAPGVVFAHNLASVSMIKDALEKKGLRVGVIQGTMSGAEKDKVKVGYNPPNPAERQYDMLVLSDAGATGLNLQNSKFLINYDLPQTSWVKQQREGRIDRHGQAHKEIDYHDLVTDTEHEDAKWKRIQRKAKLGAIFEDDANSFDDSGLGAYLAAVKAEKYNNGEEDAAA